VRRVTATEAARTFSEVLDQVERRGETFVIERRGRAVASIGPAPAASGRAVKELLRSELPDPDWPSELTELRGSLEAEDRHWNG
jgi:antitoxin (DNA-binding transcriptional repressor) of toxin-antitoxin stability system